MQHKNTSISASIIRSFAMLLFITVACLWTSNVMAQCAGASASTASASPAGPFCGSGSATLSTSAVNPGSQTYQWQSSSSYSGTYTDITGATNATYNTGTVTATTYY